MNLNTCPNHPGRVIESHECPLCHHPAVPPKDRAPYRALWLVKDEREGRDMAPTATTEPQVNMETGEIRQQTLDPEIFPAVERREVPMVKISFAGTVEMTQAEWEAYCSKGLEPGRVVKCGLTGYLPNPHSKWVKRTESEPDELTGRTNKSTWWEQEAQVKIKALKLGSFELRGFYDGE